VSDIKISGMNGLEFMKGVLEIRPMIPIISRLRSFARIAIAAQQHPGHALSFVGSAGIFGNTLQLEQVIVNLLSNAKDALVGAARKEIIIRTQTGRTATITVEDSGPGIDPHILPCIFDPFFTTKEVDKGTGLGLSISYGIVKDHGGEITADNAPNGGA
jgi:two-component system sensor histidine kinase HupT/HoxJ